MATKKETRNQLMVRTIGENLKTYREAANLPIKILAERTQLPEEELSEIENGGALAHGDL